MSMAIQAYHKHKEVKKTLPIIKQMHLGRWGRYLGGIVKKIEQIEAWVCMYVLRIHYNKNGNKTSYIGIMLFYYILLFYT